MKVLKFGRTYVGSAKNILGLKHIVEKESQKQHVIVVVSTLSEITEKLISPYNISDLHKTYQ